MIHNFLRKLFSFIFISLSKINRNNFLMSHHLQGRKLFISSVLITLGMNCIVSGKRTYGRIKIFNPLETAVRCLNPYAQDRIINKQWGA